MTLLDWLVLVGTTVFIVAWGLWRTRGPSTERRTVAPEITTPGHTIDHYSVQIGTAGDDAIITGDMIHSPLQARYPEIGMFSDYDSPQAGRTRRALFERICETPTVLCTAHFPSPSTGRIVRWDEGFRVVPL